MPDLKLLALDEEDLTVVSANLQDAVVKVRDMAFSPRERRLVLVANRFDWSDSAAGRSPTHVRRRAGLRIEGVQKARLKGFKLEDQDRVLALLTLRFEVGEAPAGLLRLVFSGGAEIELAVDCIELALEDLGAAWQTPSRPAHDEGGS